MQVLVTPEAASQLDARKSWWRANRPATADLFDREFLDAVALIGERPAMFPVTALVGGREIRRVLMEKTSCHLYYEGRPGGRSCQDRVRMGCGLRKGASALTSARYSMAFGTSVSTVLV